MYYYTMLGKSLILANLIKVDWFLSRDFWNLKFFMVFQAWTKYDSLFKILLPVRRRAPPPRALPGCQSVRWGGWWRCGGRAPPGSRRTQRPRIFDTNGARTCLSQPN